MAKYGSSFMSKPAKNLTDVSKLPNNMRQPISAPPRSGAPPIPVTQPVGGQGLTERAAQTEQMMKAGGPGDPQGKPPQPMAALPTAAPAPRQVPTQQPPPPPVGGVPSSPYSVPGQEPTQAYPHEGPPERQPEQDPYSFMPIPTEPVVHLPGTRPEFVEGVSGPKAWESNKQAVDEALYKIQQLMAGGAGSLEWSDKEKDVLWEDLYGGKAAQMKSDMAFVVGQQGGRFGAEVAAIGGINAAVLKEYSDKVIKNKSEAHDQYLKELQTYMSFYGNQLSEEEKAKMFEKMHQLELDKWALQKEGEVWTHVANWMEAEEIEGIPADTIQWIFDQKAKGASIGWIMGNLITAGKGKQKKGQLKDPDVTWEGGEEGEEPVEVAGEDTSVDAKEEGYGSTQKMQQGFEQGEPADVVWETLSDPEKENEAKDIATEIANMIAAGEVGKDQKLNQETLTKVAEFLADKWNIPSASGLVVWFQVALADDGLIWNKIWEAAMKKAEEMGPTGDWEL